MTAHPSQYYDNTCKGSIFSYNTSPTVRKRFGGGYFHDWINSSRTIMLTTSNTANQAGTSITSIYQSSELKFT